MGVMSRGEGERRKGDGGSRRMEGKRRRKGVDAGVGRKEYQVEM